MTIKEFLDRYDNKKEFSEEELYELWRSKEIAVAEEETWEEPDRWDTLVTKVLQIGNRYFMIYARIGNTEYQENSYDIQPDEVYPTEKVVIEWRIKDGSDC